MTVVSPTATFTPGLEFRGKSYNDPSKLFERNIKRARSVIEERLPVSEIFRSEGENDGLKSLMPVEED